MEHGYQNSGLRLNQIIAAKEKLGAWRSWKSGPIHLSGLRFLSGQDW